MSDFDIGPLSYKNHKGLPNLKGNYEEENYELHASEEMLVLHKINSEMTQGHFLSCRWLDGLVADLALQEQDLCLVSQLCAR